MYTYYIIAAVVIGLAALGGLGYLGWRLYCDWRESVEINRRESYEVIYALQQLRNGGAFRAAPGSTQQQQKNNSGKSESTTQKTVDNTTKAPVRKYVPGKNKVTFADVAGQQDAKEELMEIVDFLKANEHYAAMGAKIPRGVLMSGPPGTGKTLLARAVAGEAGVSFFSISGSDFVEMYVGVGAARVRDLFEQARAAAPAIIFIDELDAIGRKRGRGNSNDEREGTLNQLLVEMDGFEKNDAVIILAATNQPEALDSALTRSGRFDRQVVVDLPHREDRKLIAMLHASDKPIGTTVSFDAVADLTVGMSGADLANVMNDGAILAARRQKSVASRMFKRKTIEMPDLDEAISRVAFGVASAARARLLSPASRRVTAIHEAGHAIVAHFIPGGAPVTKVTILPRANMGGFVQFTSHEEMSNYTREQLEARIAVSLAGRCAEEIILSRIDTGASDDFEKATMISYAMVDRYGMSPLGPLGLRRANGETVSIGSDLQNRIDLEATAILERAKATTIELINRHRDVLEAVADKLIEKETILRQELEAIIKGEPVEQPRPTFFQTLMGAN